MSLQKLKWGNSTYWHIGIGSRKSFVFSLCENSKQSITKEKKSYIQQPINTQLASNALVSLALTKEAVEYLSFELLVNFIFLDNYLTTLSNFFW